MPSCLEWYTYTRICIRITKKIKNYFQYEEKVLNTITTHKTRSIIHISKYQQIHISQEVKQVKKYISKTHFSSFTIIKHRAPSLYKTVFWF